MSICKPSRSHRFYTCMLHNLAAAIVHFCFTLLLLQQQQQQFLTRAFKKQTQFFRQHRKVSSVQSWPSLWIYLPLSLSSRSACNSCYNNISGPSKRVVNRHIRRSHAFIPSSSSARESSELLFVCRCGVQNIALAFYCVCVILLFLCK